MSGQFYCKASIVAKLKSSQEFPILGIIATSGMKPIMASVAKAVMAFAQKAMGQSGSYELKSLKCNKC